jgi:hypothetical protein
MSHLRQQIREQVATTLTGLATTGSNVFQSRVYPLQANELPALLIYSKEEQVDLDEEYASMGSTRTIARKLSLGIEAVAQGVSNVDDTLDTICKEVEVAMAGDIGVNSLAGDSYLSSVSIVHEGEGNKPTTVAKMTYAIMYRNSENDPETAR